MGICYNWVLAERNLARKKVNGDDVVAKQVTKIAALNTLDSIYVGTTSI